MKKLLVLFAREFPYNVSEPFLEAEYPLYKEYFDKVLIATNRPTAAGIRGKKTREVNDPAVEIVESCFNKDLRHKLAFLWGILSDPHTYIEFFRILFRHGANLSALRNMLSSVGKANLCARVARRRCRQLEAEGYQVVGAYAYWLIYPAYAAVRFNKKYYGGKLYTVSRAHGFDLYELRHPGDYILCRKYILNNLSEIASISENGKRYLLAKHPDCNMNITIHHLGARDVGTMKQVEKGEVFRMVSCARTVPLKRIHRLVDALAQITDIPIEWTHCGGGELLDDIREKAALLPKNITCHFTDTIQNTQVYDLYRENDYHVFVNVSRIEGVPVSIMEAMSFGMPVIATNVGGTAETINVGKSGFLLDEEYDDTQLVEYLRYIYNMSQADYDEMRRCAREKFEQDYNAIPNYHKFLRGLQEKCL
ncbi:MAG: glycosyltransferase [Clostridia bacterium]|nr:glycosyltransferase [Clostridia bacterium]